MISIVIPVYNNLEITKACERSIYANTLEDSYEVIVIDNGSNPPFANPLWKNFCYIRNEENLGFPKAINQGIRLSSGDTIIILNNDCIVTPGSLRRLEAWLDNYSIIGPLTNYSAGLQQVLIPIYNDENELNIQSDKWHNLHTGESKEVNWIIGFCMAFKKSLWDKIGPFDESLWPCSGEEIIFCLRARELGLKVGISYDTFIHHHGSCTFRDLEKSGKVNYEELCIRNDKHILSMFDIELIKNQLVERS